MAEVKLIEFTGKGRADEVWHAADILMFTKETRLKMDAEGMAAIKLLSTAEKMERLKYMANTIPSSWEFVDLTFLISRVSRATAQQITRTRTASYAMQSMRVVDARAMEVVNPYSPGSADWDEFESAIEAAFKSYKGLVDDGSKLEDARGILPLNTECTLVAKYNLRNFVELIRARSSLRVQGEYSAIADQMKRLTLNQWPWAGDFFRSPHEAAIQILEAVVKDQGMQVGSGPGWDIAKAIDLIRKA